jgi:hypothetical protein
MSVSETRELSCVDQPGLRFAPSGLRSLRSLLAISARSYCFGMLASLTSARLLATSSLKNFSNSATVIGSFSTPIFASRSWAAAPVKLCSRATARKPSRSLTF